MRFAASAVVFEGVTEGKVLALSEHPEPDNAADAGQFVILSFSEEDEQDRSLGLTGLHIEGSGIRSGYGLVEALKYDGRSVLIVGRNGLQDIEVVIAPDVADAEAMRVAITTCNKANASRPEQAR